VKSEKFGQLPSLPGSPPMRTHDACDGVGPSRIHSVNHPGGQTPTLGGAVIVHVEPEQENAGKRVRPPMIAPCVLEVAAMSETRIVFPRGSLTFVIVYALPYAQSACDLAMLNDGCVKPWVRYGG
jgi:hypothetical protein